MTVEAALRRSHLDLHDAHDRLHRLLVNQAEIYTRGYAVDEVSALGLGSNGLLGFGLPEERVIGASTYIILDFPRCGPSIPDEKCRLKVMSDQIREQK